MITNQTERKTTHMERSFVAHIANRMLLLKNVILNAVVFLLGNHRIPLKAALPFELFVVADRVLQRIGLQFPLLRAG